MDVKLNVINQSDSPGGFQVVIFQKNQAESSIPVAWKVIEMSAGGDEHPFVFSQDTQVAASNAFGDATPALPAASGEQLRMTPSSSGDRLVPGGAAAGNSGGFEVMNALPHGAIDVSVYKAGRLLAVRNGLAPGQTAPFEFKPTIWVGVVSQIQQGDVLNSAIISNTDTQFSLDGIASADIVVTGGGSGANAMPYTCSLANVVKG